MTTPLVGPHPRYAARLRLAPVGGGPRSIDGAWWPRTDDLVSELPRLLTALPRTWAQIVHVTVRTATWSAFPGRMLCAGQVLHLHGNAAVHAPATVCLLAPGAGRWDLLVVPHLTDDAEGPRLMAAAFAEQ
ncbi:DUF5994 family protein [Streptomyces spectabilis]|uniref:Uncharacterized protein n=1 Tax=Streptomyces spectabilis TaxID=68270 RepID=A0A516R0Y3_STRST|nr:DUF5994 family protein [Streptomyces spectabilis]QDQ09316.1 hypothetical protein FH965_01005 [Streptomyces spectabilis]